MNKLLSYLTKGRNVNCGIERNTFNVPIEYEFFVENGNKPIVGFIGRHSYEYFRYIIELHKDIDFSYTNGIILGFPKNSELKRVMIIKWRRSCKRI